MSDFYEALGASSVQGDTEAGIDSRYEPEYSAILEEIDKLSFSAGGATISWEAVEKNAILLLSEKTKDLQVVCHLGVALCHTKGLLGVSYGLSVLISFMENFWENGWPAKKRLRGRINAVDWWHERVVTFLQNSSSTEPSLTEEEQNEMLNKLARFEELVEEYMPDASAFYDIKAEIKRLPVIAPVGTEIEPAVEIVQGDEKQVLGARPDSEIQGTEAQPDAQTEEAKKPVEKTVEKAEESIETKGEISEKKESEDARTKQKSQVSLEEKSRVVLEEIAEPSISISAEQKKVLSELYQQFSASTFAYCENARQLEPQKAFVWKIFRLALWSHITELPPIDTSIEERKAESFLPEPDLSALQRVEESLTATSFEAKSLLPLAFMLENLCVIAPFCLDIHKTIYDILLKLGSSYKDAADSVLDESAAFFTRMPTMQDYTFSGGRPFISQTTLAWLQSGTTHSKALSHKNTRGKSFKSPVIVNNSFAGTQSFSSEILQEAQAQAQEALALGDIQLALQAFESKKCASPRTNLLVKIKQLELLCQVAYDNEAFVQVALALAEHILHKVAEQSLEYWDPELALEALTVAYSAFTLDTEKYEQEIKQVYKSLVGLCPQALLE